MMIQSSLDEVIEHMEPQQQQVKLTQTKWQSRRKIEFNPSVKVSQSKELDHLSNQTRIKKSLKLALFNVVQYERGSDEKLQNSGYNQEADFFRKAEKLNLQLEKQDMDKISFQILHYQLNYEEGEVLGEGCIGLVKVLTHNNTKERFAVKQVTTNDEEIITNMVKEFRNLLKIDHPNIVKMNKLYIDFKDGFQDQSKIYVIMELVEGKEMFQSIQELGQYSEDIAKRLFRQLLSGINFLHSSGICHRDLKPNNLLCSENCDHLKITDFNVSKFNENYKGFIDIQEEDQIEMWTYTGTVAFSAPEVFIGYGYNEKVDLWSAGCVLFTMLSGGLPFQKEFLNDLIDSICSGIYTYDNEKWNSISDEAKDLIDKLLVVDVEKRLTAEKALQHDWFAQQSPKEFLGRSQLNKNIKHLTKVHERKHTKQRTICLLFGAKDILHSANSQSDIQFYPFEKVNNKVNSANLLGKQDQDANRVDQSQDSFLFGSDTSINGETLTQNEAERGQKVQKSKFANWVNQPVKNSSPPLSIRESGDQDKVYNQKLNTLEDQEENIEESKIQN